MLSPNSLVGVQDVEDVVDVRVDKLCPGLPQRLHYETDEADLRLLDVRRLPVTHSGYLQSFTSLLQAK